MLPFNSYFLVVETISFKLSDTFWSPTIGWCKNCQLVKSRSSPGLFTLNNSAAYGELGNADFPTDFPAAQDDVSFAGIFI